MTTTADRYRDAARSSLDDLMRGIHSRLNAIKILAEKYDVEHDVGGSNRAIQQIADDAMYQLESFVPSDLDELQHGVPFNELRTRGAVEQSDAGAGNGRREGPMPRPETDTVGRPVITAELVDRLRERFSGEDGRQAAYLFLEEVELALAPGESLPGGDALHRHLTARLVESALAATLAWLAANESAVFPERSDPSGGDDA